MTPASEAETRPWADQLAADDASYREQLAYLLERSAFYREKLARAGIGTVADAGGLDAIASLPLTEKRELRETCTAENPIGTHLCVADAEIARIYSTSGTTGTPSYIPLTASDLDNWITGSARSYAASGIQAESGSSRPTTRDRSSRVRRWRRSTDWASPTSRSERATPSGSCAPSRCSGRPRRCLPPHTQHT